MRGRGPFQNGKKLRKDLRARSGSTAFFIASDLLNEEDFLACVIIVHNRGGIITFRQVRRRRFLPLCKIFYYNQIHVKRAGKTRVE